MIYISLSFTQQNMSWAQAQTHATNSTPTSDFKMCSWLWCGHRQGIRKGFWGSTSGGVMYLVFTCIPGESYCRRLKPLLLYVYYIFPILIFCCCCCWFMQKGLITAALNWLAWGTVAANHGALLLPHPAALPQPLMVWAVLQEGLCMPTALCVCVCV